MHRRAGNHNQNGNNFGHSVERTPENSPNFVSKAKNRARVLRQTWLCFLFSIVSIVSIISILSENLKPKRSSDAVARSLSKKKIKPHLSQYHNCTLSQPLTSSTAAPKKPLWFPSYPTAMDDNLMKTLISKMTGLKSGAKSFYASQKRIGLRHCQSKTTETAVCLNIHPLVEMKSPGPDAFHESFDSTVVLLMRNPAIVIPAFLNQKRIKYKKLPGQMPLKEWRKKRDESLKPMWNQWKNQYLSWKNTKHYQVRMYFMYEDMMYPDRGIPAITRVSKLLQDAGFPTVPSQEIACLWYQTFGGNALDQYYQYQYDYTEYVPGYTLAQKEFLIQEMAALIEEVQRQGDAELMNILKEYLIYFKEELVVDEPWVNETNVI